MVEGLNDWEWPVGLTSHERIAAEMSARADSGTGDRGEAPNSGVPGAEPVMATAAPKARLAMKLNPVEPPCT
jgi:hypothetical protein